MTFKLPDLPYRPDALEPFLSRATLETHHGKHHRAYVDKLNDLVAGTDYEGCTLQETVVRAHTEGNRDVFNNAAQALNHSFLWESMSPDGGGAPTGPLSDAIDAAFGGLDGFQEAFRKAATGQFGSGWAWLVMDSGGLRVTATDDADTPIVQGVQPVLTLDVWEHAYYLDYRNERGRYVDTFLSDCANWQFAARNFAAVPKAA